MWAKILTTVQYLLVVVNFIFVITGLIILSVGSSVQVAFNEYHPFLSERFFSLPAFCIATGVIIFLIAFFGFYGACRQNYYMIMAFVGAMIVMFVFQLSACIAGYALRSNAIPIVQQQLLSTMDLYGVDKNTEVTILWDEVQTDFQCCGVLNATDWVNSLKTHDSGEGVPVSCCDHPYGTINVLNCTASVAYRTGCSEAFGSWVRAHAGSIAGVGLFLVFMQGLAVAGSLWMARMTRAEQI